jgi:putative transposase
MLRGRIMALAAQYGRYGYRIINGMLVNEGWEVNHKRVERIWREEGLKVPEKQPKRGRLWLHDGSCIRLRPRYTDHVWSYDFVSDKTSDTRSMKLLTILDEYSRESLRIHVDRQITSYNVIEELAELFLTRGIPAYIRSDNGPEFIAKAVRGWLKRLGVKTLFITPGSPWENGYIESFNGTLRYEVLDAEVFDTIIEARIIIEQWRRHYNQVRPHSSLGYKPPAPMAILPRLVANA